MIGESKQEEIGKWI